MNALQNYIIRQNEQFQRRLPSLYSDFSLQRETNPDGFAANITAWQDVLQKAVMAGLVSYGTNEPDILSLSTGVEFLQLLETNELGRPLALDTVIVETIKQRRMVPLTDFLDSSSDISDKDWLINPWRLISWGFHQLGVTSQSNPAEKLQEGRFVILSNVEEITRKILLKISHQSNYVDQVYSINMFRAEVATAINLTTKLTSSDLKIILTYLSREKKAIIFDDEVVKLRQSKAEMPTITIEDRTIVSLKELIVKLSLQVSSITSRVTELLNEAQNAVKIQNRSSALRALRSRKLAEISLDQKIEALLQVELIYSKIEQAADQAVMIQTMKASTGVLRSLHAHIDGVQNVEDTIEEMQNELAKVDQTSNIINEAGQGLNCFDEEALDEELETLVVADLAKRDGRSSQGVLERLAHLENPGDLQDPTLKEPIAPRSDKKRLSEPAEYEEPLIIERTKDFMQMSLE